MKPAIPKSEWGPGPWQDEPDQFRWMHAGLDCYIFRHSEVTGSLNGYVAVPPEHRWWGKDRNECIELPQCEPDPPIDYEAMAKEGWPVPSPGSFLREHMNSPRWSCAHRIESLLEVHRGITYSGPIVMLAGGESEHFAWGFGFDTGHAGDVTPAMDALIRQIYTEPEWAEREVMTRGGMFPDTYKTFDYVKHETERLAEQLALVHRQGWSDPHRWDGNDDAADTAQAVA